MTFLKLLSTKQKVVICFVLAIAISTGYFLMQIDKHERALLGRDWLDPVPGDVWDKYVTRRDEYSKIVKQYVDNNQDLLGVLKELRTQRSTDFKPYIPDEEYFTAKPDDNTWLELTRNHPGYLERKDAIAADLRARTPGTPPTPYNPPKPVIQQGITSLYRYLAATDGILILSLILFLVLHKEVPGKPIATEKEGVESCPNKNA